MKMHIIEKKSNKIVCNVLVLGLFLFFFTSLMGTGCDFIDSLPFVGKKKSEKTVQNVPTKKPIPSKKQAVSDSDEKDVEVPAKQQNQLQTKINEVRGKRKEYYSKMIQGIRTEGVFDPFVSIFHMEEQTPVVDKKASLLPLQKLKLSEITLVAVVSNGNKKLALVEDNAHFSYIVRKGTLVGPEGGRVLHILPDEVVIRYSRKTLEGMKEFTKRLKLRPSEGENT